MKYPFGMIVAGLLSLPFSSAIQAARAPEPNGFIDFSQFAYDALTCKSEELDMETFMAYDASGKKLIIIDTRKKLAVTKTELWSNFENEWKHEDTLLTFHDNTQKPIKIFPNKESMELMQKYFPQSLMNEWIHNFATCAQKQKSNPFIF